MSGYITETILREEIDFKREEIESLRASLKEKDEALQELRSKLAEAEKDIDALYGAGLWGIQYVGGDNNQHREDEAFEMLQSVYDAAMNQQSEGEK